MNELIIQINQKLCEKESEFDPDSSPNAWEFYRKIYNESQWSFWDEFDFKNLKLLNKPYRLHGKISYKKSSYVKVLGKEFKFSGDCAFNFNDKKCKRFDSLLSEKDKELLQKCKSNHHNILNFSLLPTTGGLNNFKGKLYVTDIAGVNYSGVQHQNCDDRLDSFLYCINQYFERKSKLIFCCCSEANESCLESFLLLFDDIYDFCEKLYLIRDKILVRKLLNNGKKPITTHEDVIRYMNLAIEFWEYRKIIFDNMNFPKL